jgi:hypothetical protein
MLGAVERLDRRGYGSLVTLTSCTFDARRTSGLYTLIEVITFG